MSSSRLSRRTALLLVLPGLIVSGAALAAEPVDSAEPLAIRINAGGAAHIDPAGHRWSADRHFTGGRTYRTNGAVDSATPEIDRSERFGDAGYTVPVPAGRYRVRLHVTEIYWSAPDKRLFDIDVEGARLATRLDLVATSGPRRTQLLETVVTVDDGAVDVRLRTVRDNASITGLEIQQLPDVPTPTATKRPYEQEPAPAASAPPVEPLRLNAGGPATVDATGTAWLADHYYKGGNTYATRQEVISASREVDRTERFGNTHWALPVPVADEYLLRLHLTELYWTKPGQRRFDVTAEGQPVVEDIDLLTRVAPRETLIVEQRVRVTDGLLDLTTRTVRDNASVTAIEVLPMAPDSEAKAEAEAVSAVEAPADAVSQAAGGTTTNAVPAATGDAPAGLAAVQPQGAPGSSSPVTEPGATATSPPAPEVGVEAYGAIGDGVHDDTAALQRALDQVPTGTVLRLAAGRTYRQTDVLRIRRAGVHLSGPGELRATRQERSSLWIEADDVVLDGNLLLTAPGTTRRFDAWEQMRLRLLPVSGTVVRDVTVDGAAAAGVYVGGARHFRLERVTVRNTRADGIHLTGGAAFGQVLSPTIINSGDDGVAVVSYGGDGPVVHDIEVRSPTVRGTRWGRGLSVVGGTDITYRDIDVSDSDAAGVYLAAEGAPWHTAAPVRVKVLGGTVTRANRNPRVDHGAVLVLAGSNKRVQDVEVSDLAVRDTRATAHRSVGVVTYGSTPTGVVLRGLRISGGPATSYQGNTATGYSLLDWTVDGRRVPDVRR